MKFKRKNNCQEKKGKKGKNKNINLVIIIYLIFLKNELNFEINNN